jgi:regulator of sigma E protease
LTTFVSFVVVLGLLVFVHEFGHFLAAKSAGVRVLRFSLGFGPRLIGFQRGETEYVVSALPLGGYVKMAGDESEEMEEDYVEREPGPGDYMYASLPRRAAIITAGPLMNILLALLLYTGLTLALGITLLTSTEVGYVQPESPAGRAGLRPGDRISAVDGIAVTDWAAAIDALRAGFGLRHELTLESGGESRTIELPSILSADGGLDPALADSTGNEPAWINFYGFEQPFGPRLGGVTEDGVALSAGLRVGDEITAIDGEPVSRWWQVRAAVEGRAGEPVRIAYRREGDSGVETGTVTVVPEPWTDPLTGLEQGKLGVYPDPGTLPLERRSLGPVAALGQGAGETWQNGTLVFAILKGLLSGRISMKRSLGGPVMIAQMIGDQARSGLVSLIAFMAFLSVNFGLLNLLPIPVLDGGHLVFLGAEVLRGRPLPLKVRLVATQVGMAFLLLLMIFVTFNDIMRIL